MNLNAPRRAAGKIQKSDRHGLNLSKLTSLGLSFHIFKNVQGDNVNLLPPQDGSCHTTAQLFELFLCLVHLPTLSSETYLPHLYLLSVESQGPRTDRLRPL